MKKTKKVTTTMTAPQLISTAKAPVEAVVATVALAPVAAPVVDTPAEQSDVGGGGIVNNNAAPGDQSKRGAGGGQRTCDQTQREG